MTFKLSKSIKINEFFRKEFSKPFGRVLKTHEIKKALGRDKGIYAVGDVTVSTLLKLGYMPKVSIFDYRTEREAKVIPIIKATYKRPISVVNKRGFLGVKLWNVVKKASGRKKPVGVRVIGEEDLASLACIYFARNGDFVMYGLRNRGIVTIKVDDRMKNYVMKALKALLLQNPK